ncbi:FAD dependent oxidoreductase [Colletotrichum higginsianum IMI 349063]|uniref:FAD dependent oxidoreductase n=2 Tax=Colletotrichum higginsianum TaxID=80884 RepID=A0A1B7YFF9_COLHI|nr:FAD dependent oxidoreductase [Colletotrichum higginsianum IMI 349063]OBR10745.1 FAD dependent oxidoreductase [Colletotrichum higginsianum IMI 349063]TID06257.1 putative oxidoreductase OrdL [Colletotrichum higginsianum]GJD00972.1 FAD dependent oxidoreductase [Colletotrichum higginsianum]
MDKRARIPVTLPVANPTESYWHYPPSRLSNYCSSASPPSETDTLIIGSGITGAAVAHFLLASPSAGTSSQQTPSPPDITMLEARTVTSGATGRNGGHTKAASYRSFLHHEATLGTEAACRIARLELANIRAVHAFAATHLKDRETESRPCQTVDAIYDAVQWEAAKRAIEAMREAMPGEDASKYDLYDADETQSRFHVSGEGLHGGVAYEAGSISAYRFATGVLELCVDKGLKLFTETPAVSVERLDGTAESGHRRWVVQTPKGRIAARKVVLATNGYTAFLDRRFQEAIVPTRGQIVAHRPGSKMPKEGLPTTYSFIYEGGYEYMIPRPAGAPFAGDIVIGGGLVRAPEEGLEEYGTTDDSRLNPIVSSYLHETTPRYFGDNWGDDDDAAGGRLRAEWTGIMGFSPDGFPFVGQVPGSSGGGGGSKDEGLWVSAGFQGHGMVFCWMCAKALVAMMLDMAEEDKEEEKQRLSSWFPEAFRITEARLKQRFHGRVNHSASGPSNGGWNPS